MKKLLFLSPLVLFTFSCSIKPEPIHYGEENCVHCQMTIMDHRYGTEAVTGKGKVYKFDSIECLIEYINENDQQDYPLILFTPFDKPGTLIDARKSHVLHSENLPSPMGMYLTAFETEATALSFKDTHGGKVFCWKGLMERFPALRAGL